MTAMDNNSLNYWLTRLGCAGGPADGHECSTATGPVNALEPVVQTDAAPSDTISQQVEQVVATGRQQLQSIFPFFSNALQSISRPAMACQFEVLLNDREYPQGVELAVESLDHISRIENLLSVYQAASQFSKLNQFASLRPVHVDPLTLEVIRLAADVHRWTVGCFDITAGTLSETWGFARRQGAMPEDSQIQLALTTIGTQHIQVDELNSTIAFDIPGLKLNSGGIGKGFAIDHAARHLKRSGIDNFMIHGGLSSIVANGQRCGLNHHWTVGLKHPWRNEELLETFPLSNQALGTSGSGKQFFHFGGKRYSHLIDPRTGWPADEMMSVTVICSSCAVADALATGLFIMGVEGARQFCEAHPEVSAILIYLDPQSGSQRIERLNWKSLT